MCTKLAKPYKTWKKPPLFIDATAVLVVALEEIKKLKKKIIISL